MEKHFSSYSENSRLMFWTTQDSIRVWDWPGDFIKKQSSPNPTKITDLCYVSLSKSMQKTGEHQANCSPLEGILTDIREDWDLILLPFLWISLKRIFIKSMKETECKTISMKLCNVLNSSILTRRTDAFRENVNWSITLLECRWRYMEVHSIYMKSHQMIW